MLIVDDHLLFAALTDVGPAELDGQEIASTVGWWFRLGRALQGQGGGVHTRRAAGVDEDELAYFEQALDELPEWIEIVDPRDIVPLMIDLAVQHRLNFLMAEALAVALVLGAPIRVARSNDAPLLGKACRALDVDYRTIEL